MIRKITFLIMTILFLVSETTAETLLSHQLFLPLVLKPLNIIPGEVTVKSYTTYTRGRDRYVVGEIVNSTDHTVTDVDAHAGFKFAGNESVYRNASAYIRVLAPQQTAPFKMVVSGGSEPVQSVKVSLSYGCCDKGQYPYRYPLSVTSANVYDQFGVFIEGYYRNTNTFTLYDPIIVATFYNTVGQVVGVEVTHRELAGLVDSPIPAGWSDLYHLETTILPTEFVTYTLQGEGYAYP
jgi:hypothetical protein